MELQRNIAECNLDDLPAAILDFENWMAEKQKRKDVLKDWWANRKASIEMWAAAYRSADGMVYNTTPSISTFCVALQHRAWTFQKWSMLGGVGTYRAVQQSPRGWCFYMHRASRRR